MLYMYSERFNDDGFRCFCLDGFVHIKLKNGQDNFVERTDLYRNQHQLVFKNDLSQNQNQLLV